MSYGDVRSWQPGPLDDTLYQLDSWQQSLLTVAGELRAATPRVWYGPAATAASASRGSLVDNLEHVVAGVQAVRSALLRAADGVAEIAAMVNDVESQARDHGFGVDAAGHIQVAVAPSVPSGHVGTATGAAALALAFLREIKREELKVSVRKIMERAGDVDDALAEVLGAVDRGEVGDLPARVPAGVGEASLWP